MNHKIRSIYVTLIAIVLLALLAACGGGSSDGSSSGPSVPNVSSDPSDADIIEAVQRSVRGSTYTVTVYEQRQVTRRCSQLDVDLDPYMPRNPELAKCPRVGATYHEWESVPVQEQRDCQPLPATTSGWSVQPTGSDRWRASYGGSTWNVEKLSGGSASQGDTIRVSSFTFSIVPNQDC